MVTMDASSIFSWISCLGLSLDVDEGYQSLASLRNDFGASAANSGSSLGRYLGTYLLQPQSSSSSFLPYIWVVANAVIAISAGERTLLMFHVFETMIYSTYDNTYQVRDHLSASPQAFITLNLPTPTSDSCIGAFRQTQREGMLCPVRLHCFFPMVPKVATRLAALIISRRGCSLRIHQCQTVASTTTNRVKGIATHHVVQNKGVVVTSHPL